MNNSGEAAKHATPKTRMVTSELRAIVTSAVAGESFKIPAFAGTGKTSGLELIAEAVAPRRMLYVAFNTAMAQEARPRFRRFSHVTVSTANALAWKAVGDKYGPRLEKRSIAARSEIEKRYTQQLMRISYRVEAASDAVFGTLQAYMNSASLEIDVSHVPDIRVVASRQEIVKLAGVVFADMLDVQNDLPILHDTYFKAWQIGRPRLDEHYDIIANDEAQDGNPVFLAVLDDQSCQRIYVGDSHQSLYGWRLAVDAIESLDLPEFPLTRSWRFGANVAAYANAILATKGEGRSIVGSPSVQDYVVTAQPAEDELPPPRADMVLARTNAGVFEAAIGLVRRNVGVTIVRGVDELIEMILGAYELQTHGRSTHPDFRFFRTWADLEKAAQGPRAGDYAPFVRIVERYGDTLPELCALIRNGVESNGVRLSTVHTAKGLEGQVVELEADFQPFCFFDPRSQRIVYRVDEANIMYLAVTRAKRTLLAARFHPIYQSSLEMSARLGAVAIEELRLQRLMRTRHTTTQLRHSTT